MTSERLFVEAHKREDFVDEDVPFWPIIKQILQLYWTTARLFRADTRKLDRKILEFLRGEIDWRPNVFRNANKKKSYLLPVGQGHTQRRPRILIDVSHAASDGTATGIQRVVREFARQAYESGAGLPVVIKDGHAYEIYPNNRRATVPLRVEPSDRLLLLDSSWHRMSHVLPFIRQVKSAGGIVVGYVYDMIPVIYPACFAEDLPIDFTAWLDELGTHADAIITISRSVALDVRDRMPDIPIGVAHLACEAKTFKQGKVSEEAQAACDTGGFFVTVGTIEPRKGLAIILAAFESLWNKGAQDRLVIVGRAGWNMSHFQKRLLDHPELDRRLFWLRDSNDVDLDFAYRTATAMISASIAEGFGLPIIEAAHYGLPVIVSDIPVFREVGHYSDATYFSPADPADLADKIARRPRIKTANPSTAPILTWRDVVEAVSGMLRSPTLFAARGCILSAENCTARAIPATAVSIRDDRQGSRQTSDEAKSP